MTVTVQTLDNKRQVLAGRNLLTLPDSVMMYVVIQDLPKIGGNLGKSWKNLEILRNL